MLTYLKMLLVCIVFVLTFVINAQEIEQGYRVVEVIDLELLSGPARTSTFISPDGNHFAYFSNNEVCLYTLPENEVDVCYDLGEDNMTPINLETVRWSPNGRYIAYSDQSIIGVPYDPDIQLLDLEQGELRNITDDNFDGSLVREQENDISYNVDVAVAWSNHSDLAILRYLGNTVTGLTNTVQVVHIDIESTDVDILIEDSFEEGEFPYLTIAWFDNTIALGRTYFFDDYDESVVSLFNTDIGQLEQDVPVSDNLPDVENLHFSENGDYLFAYSSSHISSSRTLDTPELDGAAFINLSNDMYTSTALDEDRFVVQAGFAPEGQSIAYIVWASDDEEESGLYIATSPEEQGELVLPMESLRGPTTYSTTQLIWARNNMIIVSDGDFNTLLIILERFG